MSLAFAAVVSPQGWLRRLKLASKPSFGSAVSTTVKDRMHYWKSEGPPPHPFATHDRYLLFDYDSGGLNNIRMGWEMAAIAAIASNRTLVYPPLKLLYLKYAEPSGLDYYVNMQQLRKGLSVISLAEFLQKELPRVNHKHAATLLKWALRSDNVKSKDAAFPSHLMHELRRNLYVDVAPGGQTRGDVEVCDMARYRGPQRVLYSSQPGARIFSCGNWPNVGEPRFTDGSPKAWSTPDWAMLLLRNHFVWHPDAFDIASRVVEHLGIWNYVAIHARYGDFQFQEAANPASTLLHNGWLAAAGSLANSFMQVYQKVRHAVRHRASATSGIMRLGSTSKARGRKALGLVNRWLREGGNRTVYVSTDEQSPEYLEPFHAAGLRVVRWQELMDQAKRGKGPLAGAIKEYSHARFDNLAGLVEQIICTYGRVFIGSEKSTFTGFIERMRLYAGAPTAHTFIQYDGLDASDKGLRLFHDDPVDPAVELGVQKELEDFDRRHGALNRDDVGRLPVW
jgi:hypothetical protein